MLSLLSTYFLGSHVIFSKWWPTLTHTLLYACMRSECTLSSPLCDTSRMEFSIENHIDRQWIFRTKFCGLSKLKFDIHFVSGGYYAHRAEDTSVCVCVRARTTKIERERAKTVANTKWTRQKPKRGSTNYLFRLNINSHARKCHGFVWKFIYSQMWNLRHHQ